LKTTTLSSKTRGKTHKVFFTALIACFSVASFAQLQNNGILYVKDNSSVYLKTGNYGFGTTSGNSSATTRTGTTYGKVIFASGTSTSGATNDHFLNGYGSFLGVIPFTMPVGQTGVLAPVIVDPSAATGVDVAFYKATPDDNLDIDPLLSEISDNEYWDFRGVASKVTLSYRGATVANFTTTDYTIVGYNTTTEKWDIIPSAVDAISAFGGTSTPAGGSVKSAGDVDFATYRYLTIGSKGEPCAILVPWSNNTRTWTAGGWENGIVPTIADAVIINAPYAAGSFECNSLLLNADVTLSGTQYIDCVNEAGGTGKIILASTASFVQRNDNATNKPLIELTKRTDIMRRYDYVYLGAPLVGNALSDYATAKALTGTLANALDNYLRWDVNQPITPINVSGWVPATATSPGTGFIARVKQQAPFTNLTNTDQIDIKLDGVTNNGVVPVEVAVNAAASLNGSKRYNLLGNPYPSAISADKFLVENEELDGVVYIWTSATSYIGSGNYSQSDYIAYTRLGTTSSNGISTSFNGNIASGQGFQVKVLTPGTIEFNNCMRLTNSNTNLYKSASTVVDRYKVNMTGSNDVFSQILVGYTPETTLGYDRMYDAGRNSVSTAQLFTLLDNSTLRLAINARPSFTQTDVVPVGITKTSTATETFQFSLADAEGVFNSGTVQVYLHDKVLNTYHNLSTGNYTLTTNETNISNRFELVYQTDGSLSNPEFDAANTLVSLNDNVFKVTSSKEIASISIFDIAGRLMANYNSVNDTTFVSDFNKVQGVYVAKITHTDGTVVSEKLLQQ